MSQCYSVVDFKEIRNNLNMIILFKQNKHYTRLVFYDFIGAIGLEKFMEMCDRCWSEDCGFLAININLKAADGKYMDKFEALTCQCCISR